MRKYEKDFPFQKIIVAGLTKKFNLSDPDERKEYFEAKAGGEIKKLREYFARNTFIAYMLGKKNAGKGTYSKLMKEIFGAEKITHISVGDIVRDVHASVADEERKEELVKYLEKNYRGYISISEAIDALLGRSTKTLLPTEFILALVKREIEKMPKKTLFIDGFPREMDQISYTFFLRDLINFREDRDLIVAIDIPESVIDARMKNRVICPICHTPRSLKLMVTKKVGFDKESGQFYLICDDPACNGARMIGKEGDELGIETIRERIELDQKIIDRAFSLHGIPKILLRNSIPVDAAKELVDDWELTPEYDYESGPDGEIRVLEKPWIIKDDEGRDAYSLLAPPVVVSWIKQLVKVLEL